MRSSGRALLYALNQVDPLEATIGDKEYYIVCKSLYPCGSTFATEAGYEDKLTATFRRPANS